MEPTSETRVLDTPCVICGGTITITVEIADSQHPGWVTTIECENQCDLTLISPLWGGLRQPYYRGKKTALEEYLTMSREIFNEISLARQKCEFCGQTPQLKEQNLGYKFLCSCPSLNSTTPRDTISRAAQNRCHKLQQAREEIKKQRKLDSQRPTIEQFNKRSERLTEAAQS